MSGCRVQDLANADPGSDARKRALDAAATRIIEREEVSCCTGWRDDRANQIISAPATGLKIEPW